MARKRAAASTAKKNSEPTLEFEDGYWWIVDGSKKENAGRSKRYAEKLLNDRKST